MEGVVSTCLEPSQDLVDLELDVIVGEFLALECFEQICSHQLHHQIPSRQRERVNLLNVSADW